MHPFNHLFSSPLNRCMKLSLVAAFNFTHCKSIEGLSQLLSKFQVLAFLQIIGYYYINLFMAKFPFTQKPGNLFEFEFI